MSIFEDQEWGSSDVFSYYGSSGSTDFVVSSSVLESSLKRKKKKLKKEGGGGGELQKNEKRKLAEDGTGETDCVKKKKQKPGEKANLSSKVIKNKATGNGPGSVGEKQSNAPDSADILKKKSITGKSDLVNSKKNVTGEGEAEPLINNPKKKKKKNVKRNKYKQLHIEQIKRDVNAKSLKPFYNPLSNVVKSNKISNESVGESGAKEGEVVSHSLKKLIVNEKSLNKSPEDTSEILETNDITTSNKKKKKKRKKISQCSEDEEVAAFSDTPKIETDRKDTSEILETNDITSSNKKKKKKRKKVSQCSEDEEVAAFADTPKIETDRSSEVNISKSVSKTKKKRIKDESEVGKDNSYPSFANINGIDRVTISTELSEKEKSKRKKKGEKSVESSVEKPSESEGKSERKKRDGVKNTETSSKVEAGLGSEKGSKTKKKKCLSSSDKDVIDPDSEDDIELQKSVEDYLEKLNFDKLKNGKAFDVALSSDEEWNEMSGEESEEECIEELPKKKKKSSKTKVAVNSDIVNDKHESKKGAVVKLSELNSPVSPENATKKGKFDKDILSKMLLEEEQKDIKESKSVSKPPTLSAADALREKMTNQLNAARFRIVNEQMYTATSKEAAKMFKTDPSSFNAYHDGYKLQVARWPVNPLDTIIKWLKNKPKCMVVADFGCGEAILATSVPQTTVHSFDLMAANSRVTACDMSHTPLPAKSVDVVVFCLSLMGTNIKDFILEANRVLKEGGIMKIAEVESRFTDMNNFVNHIKKFGFHSIFSDTSTKYFYLFQFKKHRNIKDKGAVPDIILKPCKYKKR